QSITVTPPNLNLIIDGTTPATQVYGATGTFSDGHTADITSKVGFSVGDPALGHFDANDFTSGIDHGGITNVLASAGNITGHTALTLTLKQRYVDPGSTGLPPDPGSQFGGPSSSALAPQLVYPNDGVLVPPNLGKLEFHFKPASGTSLFAIQFENAVTD